MFQSSFYITLLRSRSSLKALDCICSAILNSTNNYFGGFNVLEIVEVTISIINSVRERREEDEGELPVTRREPLNLRIAEVQCAVFSPSEKTQKKNSRQMQRSACN